MEQTVGMPCTRRPGLGLALLTLLLLLAPGWLAVESSAEVACPSCNDFNACTVDSCDTAFGTCRHVPLDCNDQNPCTQDSCTPGASASCQHSALPMGAACDDHNTCTHDDACNGSQQCTGALLPSGASCDDGNGCTATDTCDAAGACQGSALNPGDGCEDGSACTTGETCVNDAGTLICRSSGPGCDDANPCTQDFCDESTGLCLHPDVNCDDGNSCTGDACDPASGSCLRTFLQGACQDGNLCTAPDGCFNGNCSSGPIGCTDGNPCTDDSCDPTRGCIYTPRNCSDGNACTFDDCIFGTCNHPPVPCDDQLACTLDSCSSVSGCIHEPQCSDGDPCTTDTCTASGCTHAPAPIGTLALEVSLAPNILTPFNHKMIAIAATVTPSDTCGGALTVRLDSITSSEPDDAAGPTDGRTTEDIQGAAIGTPDFNFELRAERDREGSGRIYHVTYSAADALGRTASVTAIVFVPLHRNNANPSVPAGPSQEDPGRQRPGSGVGRN